jgi:hypothetical protein
VRHTQGDEVEVVAAEIEGPRAIVAVSGLASEKEEREERMNKAGE